MARQQYSRSNPARNQDHGHHTFVAESRSDLWWPAFTAIGAWADPEREAPAIDWAGFEARMAAQSPIERVMFESRLRAFLARVERVVFRWKIKDRKLLEVLEQRAHDLRVPLATVW